MLADVVIVEGAINLLIAIIILNVLRVGNTIGPKLVNIVNHSPPIPEDMVACQNVKNVIIVMWTESAVLVEIYCVKCVMEMVSGVNHAKRRQNGKTMNALNVAHL